MKKIFFILFISLNLNASIFTIIPLIYQGYSFVNSYIKKSEYSNLEEKIKKDIEKQEQQRLIKDTNEILYKTKHKTNCENKYKILINKWGVDKKYNDWYYNCLESNKLFVKNYYKIDYHNKYLNNKEQLKYNNQKTKNRKNIVDYCKIRYSIKTELQRQKAINCAYRNFNLNNLN